MLLCGSAAFADALDTALGPVPGMKVVGRSQGEAMAAELTRAGWPDVVLVDDAVGRNLATGEAGPGMRGAAGRCGVVMIADPEGGRANDPQPIKARKGWSLVLVDSASDGALVGRAVQAAARGVPSVDPALDGRLIAYITEEPRRSLRVAGHLQA